MMIDPASVLSRPLAVVLAAGVFLLCLLWFSSSWLGYSTPKSGARVPRGSFGWPILGETIEFARSPENFATARQKRYGSIFKSNLLLRKVILGTTPDFARFVFCNSHLFKIATLPNLRRILPNAFSNKDGPSHFQVKKVFMKFLHAESLQSKVQMLETIILQNLASWYNCGTVNGREATQKITLETAVYLLFGVTNIGSTPEGKAALHNLNICSEAIFTLPVNCPGFALHKALKAMEGLKLYIKDQINVRKGHSDHSQTNLLGVLLAAKDDPGARPEVKDLDDDAIADNVIAMWFGFYETTATTLTWVLKFLAENSEVFRRVQEEQDEILIGGDKPVGRPRLDWDRIKKMVYTEKFFKELQRMISIAAIVPRIAAEDVEYNGYLIPKGWAVYPVITSIHSDPSIYPDPKTFKPERFDDAPKSYTYLAFSGGPHMCPGIEAAKLVTFTVIHHLCTTYIFEKAGLEQGTMYGPLPSPVGGYPINIRRRHE